MNLTAKNTHGVIRFSLKESIKSLEKTPRKESLILFHCSSKGQRFKKSTGFKCSLSQWDIGKQRVKTGKGMMATAYKINRFINNLEAFAEEEMTAMKNSNGYIEVDKLSQLIQLKIRGEEEEKEEVLTLIEYAKNLSKEKKEHVTNSTYETYNQAIALLEEYQNKHKEVLTFKSIDMVFYRKFKVLLTNKDYSLNTIGKHVKTLKTFLNEAFVNGLTNNVIFKSKNFKVDKEITTDIYLTEKEIEILAKEDLSNLPKMQLARDIFLIGCYTGQRVSDYNGITKENIEIMDGHKFIKIRQKKTDTIVHIPITAKIQEVMRRYDNDFPPKMILNTLRKNIKEVCKKVGFTELISTTCTKGGELIKNKIPKYQLVKTHTARRSFCTNYYIASKSIQDIMLYSGHKTEKNFYRYIRIEREQKALTIFQRGFFD